MVCIVLLQTALAATLGRLGLSDWWLALLLAYFVGAFANHCLYVIIHEATHRLIFRSRTANNLVAIISDLPNALPGAIGFGICHLKHHSHQGHYGEDADIASDWEATFVGNRWFGKALWLLLFPVFQLTRPIRLKRVSVLSGWAIVNLIFALTFDFLMVTAFGLNALVYLIASLFFSIGLHPLGGRWIQEHFTTDPAHETRSYYGALNALALNVGFHNEHHDFPAVPWSRLPKVRAAAPEFYESLPAIDSWLSLWLTFIFDSRYSLYSRVLRQPAG